MIATGTWSIQNAGTPTAGEELQILVADPASPLDRWHMSWLGPRRERPHAVFVLRGSSIQGTAALNCDLGDASPPSMEQREASEWMARTISLMQ